jgi:hypothetical protein
MDFLPYDSELHAAQIVIDELNKKQKTHTDLEDFRQEAIERFNKIGLIVDVKVYDTDQPGVYAFDLELQGRHSKAEFDYDQMSHEVTNDILDVLPNSEKGQKINVNKLILPEHGKHGH